MEIISRAEAQAQGLAHYYTGKRCRNGHLKPRRISDQRCLGCNAAATRRWLSNPDNRQRDRERVANWHAKNPDYNKRAHAQTRAKAKVFTTLQALASVDKPDLNQILNLILSYNDAA